MASVLITVLLVFNQSQISITGLTKAISMLDHNLTGSSIVGMIDLEGSGSIGSVSNSIESLSKKIENLKDYDEMKEFRIPPTQDNH